MKFKEILEKTIAQAVPILVTALISVLISILQSFLASYAGANNIATDPAQVGVLGAGLKAMHTGIQSYRHIV